MTTGMAGPTLHLLCAGAAQGLVKALQADFLAETGARLEARFGAVGAMKAALLAGEACDVFVSTDSMQQALAAEGIVRGDTRRALGRVRTGIALRADQPAPALDSADALKAALLASDSIYFPDALQSTAGIHFAAVLRTLGISGAVASRLRTFPNGATAMRELARSTSPQPIGCTQVTEILYTPGVKLVAMLPKAFELATVYAAAVTARSAAPEMAQHFVERMTAAAAEGLRREGGFED